MRNVTTCLKEEDLIRPDQIELITGMDAEGSQREYEYIIRSLGTGSKDLTIEQFCNFSGYDCQEVIGFLNPAGRAVEPYFADDHSNKY